MHPCLSRQVQETGSRVEESAAFRLAILQMVLLGGNIDIWLDLRIFGIINAAAVDRTLDAVAYVVTTFPSFAEANASIMRAASKWSGCGNSVAACG